ncbi:hypothetical protein GGR57DRAFT_488416 [Xylariaceae sp. FL1272]|nr:hypothetical protein GGR57DRAFT_488416 [Xylariaceae sp. FL1272]
MLSVTLLQFCLTIQLIKVTHAWADSLSSSQHGFQQTFEYETLRDGCKQSRVGRYDMARSNAGVFFSTGTTSNPEWPSIEPMNTTAGEQWEFDGMSSDGQQALVFGFYRDPNYSFFGTGNLRMYAEFVLSDGSRYLIVDYAEDSVIEWCPDTGTRGVWRGEDWVYTFQIAPDMSVAHITMENPEAKAKVSMRSLAPPRYANNRFWPDEQGDPSAVLHFYWIEPIPVSQLEFEGTIHGKSLSWIGMGGHERLWGAFNWRTCLEGMTAVRLWTGPYALSLVEFMSGREPGIMSSSILLVSSENEVFFQSNSISPKHGRDYFQIKKLYNGTGATTHFLADKVTGVELVLISPGRQLEWRFVVAHNVISFEYVLGGGRGGTAYAGSASGGLQGSRVWNGPAFSEFMRFPEHSLLLSKNYA